MLRHPAPARAILFDLDGTLVDTAPDLVRALNTVLAAHARPELQVDALRHEASNGSRGMLRAGFDLAPGDPGYADLQQQFLQAYSQTLCQESRVFQGIEALLERLDQAGLAWGIVTNKPVWLARPLVSQLGLKPAVMLGGDSGSRPKPAADTLELACAHLRLSPPQCLYVGDAKRDIDAGRGAGMRTICAAFGYLAPDDDPTLWGADQIAQDVDRLWPTIQTYLN